MMEIDVFGARYGEATVISFGAREHRQFGVIDCHPRGGDPKSNPIVRFLKDRDAKRLAFVIATHPHEDHIKGLDQVIEAYSNRIDFFGWWGGASPSYQVAYFKQLGRQFRAQARILGSCAASVERLLDVFDSRRGPPMQGNDATDGHPYPFYESAASDGVSLKITAVSPCLAEQSKFVRSLVSGVHSDAHIDEHRWTANQASLALLIEYGKARIVLGGDVELPNWLWAFSRSPIAALDPEKSPVHFVKIPHHGSSTAVHPDMWERLKKFACLGDQQTVAVVTRYTLGGMNLPEDDVLTKIASAGCEVWVVGGNQPPTDTSVTNEAVRRHGGRYDPLCQFHAKIDRSGRVRVTDNPHNRKVRL